MTNLSNLRQNKQLQQRTSGLDSAEVLSITGGISGAGGGSDVYETLDSLPTSSLVRGRKALVSSLNRLYLSDGSGWYNTAVIGDLGVEYELLYTLDNPNTYGVSNTDDHFGGSLAMADGRLVVGALNAIGPDGQSPSSTSEGGRVYVYDVATGNLQYTLNNLNVFQSGFADRFGRSVATNSSWIIVGADGEDAPSTDYPGWSNSYIEGSGKVYVYNTSGTYRRMLSNPNAYTDPENDAFGRIVALDDRFSDLAVVSTKSEVDTNNNPNSGIAYVFNVRTGALIRTLQNPDPPWAYDEFGVDADISNGYAIVGASFEDRPAGLTNVGVAYIFNATTGGLVDTLENPPPSGQTDLFGQSVAISGSYAVVGAPFEYDASSSNSGKAYIFKTTSGDWSDTTLLHTLDNPNAFDTASTTSGDNFGSGVTIDGNYVLVTAPVEDDAESLSEGNNSGKVYVFDIVTGTLVDTIDNPNAYGTAKDDKFGDADMLGARTSRSGPAPIAISGDYIAVGAREEDEAGSNGAGKAYVFKKRL